MFKEIAIFLIRLRPYTLAHSNEAPKGAAYSQRLGKNANYVEKIKHSSLLRRLKLQNVYAITTWSQCYKTFFRGSRIFVLS